MTLPTFVTSSTAGDASGTNLSINRPGAALNGRVRVMVVYIEITNPTVTISGWTEITASAINNANGASADFSQRAFYRRDDGTDGATYTIEWGGASAWRGAVCCAYDDVINFGDPTEQANSNESEAGTDSIVGLGITTQGTDRKAIFELTNYYGSGATFINLSAGNIRGSLGALAMISDDDRVSAGATGNYTVSDDNVDTRAWTSTVFGLIGYYATTFPGHTQEGFRFRNDNGSELTATWRQPQDTNDVAAKEETIRLRVVIDATGDNDAKKYELQYRKQGQPGWTRIK